MEKIVIDGSRGLSIQKNTRIMTKNVVLHLLGPKETYVLRKLNISPRSYFLTKKSLKPLLVIQIKK